MQVLREGPKQKSWAGVWPCTGEGFSSQGCGSFLLVDKADLFIVLVHDEQRDGTVEFVTIRCPVCGANSAIGEHMNPPLFNSELGGVRQGVRHPFSGFCHPNKTNER